MFTANHTAIQSHSKSNFLESVCQAKREY